MLAMTCTFNLSQRHAELYWKTRKTKCASFCFVFLVLVERNLFESVVFKCQAVKAKM